MRKALLVLVAGAICLLPGKTSAQTGSTQAGSILVGGSLAYAGVKLEQANNWTHNLTLSPAAAYFVFNNFALGLSPTFTRTWTKGSSVSVQAYFLEGIFTIPVEGRIRPKLDVSIGLLRNTSSETNRWDSTKVEISQNGLGIRAGVGIYCFLSDHLALDTGISYFYSKYYKHEIQPEYKSNSLLFGLGLVGFLY